MLRLKVESKELFDESTGSFIYQPKLLIDLEHSLLAISKWESKYQTPFLATKGETRTNEEIKDYIEAMVVSIIQVDDNGKHESMDVIDLEVLSHLGGEELAVINRYIESKESATTFSEDVGGSKAQTRGEIITSELVYYWMVAANIPFECETWNLNRLFALIRVCGVKNQPKKNMPRHAIAARNRELNNARRAQLGTTG